MNEQISDLITGDLIQRFPINEIHPYENNPKKHPAAQINELVEDFKKVGFNGVIVIDEANIVLSGHGRLLAAKKAGFDVIPVHKKSGLTEAQKAYFRIRDNTLPGLATFDEVMLQGESDIAKLGGLDPKLLDNGEPLKSSKRDAGGMEDCFNDSEEDQSSFEVEAGDVFSLGKHRIICGDSTKIDTYKNLLGDARADLVFTDPPYGVSFKDTFGNSIRGDLSQATISMFFKHIVEFALAENGRIYCCGGVVNIPVYFSLWENYLRSLPHLIIWVKDNFTMRRNNYHSKYELIFFGWKGKGGGSEFWYSDRTADDVWTISRDPSKEYIHPTQKPVELAARAIMNSSKIGDVVLEPFLGSGSTLMAAHSLDRVCYGIELDPHFVRKICRRFYSLVVSKGEAPPSILRNGEPMNESLFLSKNKTEKEDGEIQVEL